MPNVPGMQHARTKQECLAAFWNVIAEAEAHLALNPDHTHPCTKRSSRLDTTTAPASKAPSAAR